MLPEPGALAVFIVAALVLLVVPGPAVLYIVAQSISRGRLAGIVSMLGIQVGGLVHIVKYAGAAYLVFLGLRRLLGREQLDTVGARPEKSLRRLFAQGIVVNVLNPKTALFFFSFLPQFVDVEQGSVALQIATLGLIFILLATVSDGLYALAAGSAAGWLRGRPGFVRGERFATGGVLVGLGVIAAFSGANKSR
jgi:threonine/homoserine/homoserine lactone efflux protein